MSLTAPRNIQAGTVRIGRDHPVRVVAEAGVNHNGDLTLAQRLVIEAKRAGADFVKFQTFSAARVASAAAQKAPYQLRSTDARESQLEMLRRLELDHSSLEVLRDLAVEQGIEFLSTPYNPEDVDILESIGVSAYKVASALIVEPGLLRRVAQTGKPILLSTGLATLAEVEDAVGVIRSAGNDDIVLLQCTTDYPADPADANLRAMRTMESCLGALVGYSDHTVSSSTAVAAVALGAVVIEKHLTLDRSLHGPDQATSATPDELRELVLAIRDVEAALGDGLKHPSDAELANRDSMRRSLVASQVIPAGATLAEEMLTTKRPATGIAPRDLPDIVGRRLKVEVAADRPLEWWMLE
jgi:N,N'-diacetyllegionaminate synthase